MQQMLCFILGAVLVFPVFVTTNFQIFKGGLNNYEFSLPLSIAFCLFILIYGFLNFIKSLKYPIPALFLVMMSFLVGVSVLMTSFGNPSLMALYLFFAMLGFFLPWCLEIQTDSQITLFLNGVFYSLTMAALLHITDSFLTYGVRDSFIVRGVDCVFGVFSIYQKFIYYSTLLAIGSYIAIRQGKGLIKYFSLVVLITDIIMIGAREALILVLFFYIVNGIASKEDWNLKIIYGVLYLISSFILFAMFYYLGHYFFPESILIAKIGTLVEGGDASGLSAGRYNAIQHTMAAFDIDIPFMIWGSGFSIVNGVLSTPHNQYVEWFLRGGVFFLGFNLLFLVYPAIKMLGSKRYPLVTLGTILWSVILISNNVNTPFRVPYMSIFLWIIIGIFFRVMSLNQQGSMALKSYPFHVENKTASV